LAKPKTFVAISAWLSEVIFDRHKPLNFSSRLFIGGIDFWIAPTNLKFNRSGITLSDEIQKLCQVLTAEAQFAWEYVSPIL